jgi:hypothetical protein
MGRRMNSLGVVERAHLRTNMKEYTDNWERIFGKDKPLHDETPSESTPVPEVQGVPLQEDSEGCSIEEGREVQGDSLGSTL